MNITTDMRALHAAEIDRLEQAGDDCAADAMRSAIDGWLSDRLSSGARLLAELAPQRCRWPIGDLHDALFRWCAAPR